MKRSLRTLLAAACLTALSLPVPASLQAQEAVPVVAVLPLQGNGVSAERTRMLGHRLRKLMARKYNRTQIDYALLDSTSGFDCHNAQCAAEKGRLLKADQVLFGQIRNQQNEYQLHLMLIDTRTGKPIQEMIESCNYCEFNRVLKNLAPDVLEDMDLSQEAAVPAGQLAKWENFVGYNVMFDYPSELELRDKVFSHRDGSYLYMLNVKEDSPFFVSILEFKKPDIPSSSWNGMHFFRESFRQEYVLNENGKVKYSLGNKQVEGIPYMSKPGAKTSKKGMYLLFENTYNIYQIQFDTPLSVTGETERLVNQFFAEFLKTVYVD